MTTPAADVLMDFWLASADRHRGPDGHRRRDDILTVWDRDPTHLAILPCGTKWDAITTPTQAGMHALQQLLGGPDKAAVGPVLHDPRDGLHWLVPVELHPDHWTALRGVQHLGHGHHIAAVAPGRGVTRPAEWIHLPDVTGILTPPHLLAAALTAAIERSPT